MNLLEEIQYRQSDTNRNWLNTNYWVEKFKDRKDPTYTIPALPIIFVGAVLLAAQESQAIKVEINFTEYMRRVVVFFRGLDV